MFTTRPELAGTHGMVASTHWLASAAGMAVLEDDGNAFDAAVAAGLVLQVVEPHLNGPGGELPALFATADDPRPRALAAQGPAPAGATVAHYRDELGLDLVPGTGLLATTVPGAWDGWLLLLRDHGTKSLREVLKYAIGYARGGYPIVERISTTIDTVREMFREHWQTSANLWLTDGAALAPGSVLRNPALADTWERLLTEAEAAGPGREAQIDAARRAWSQGFVAEAVDKFARIPHRDNSGRDHAGVITAQDMAEFEAGYETPLTIDLPGGWTLAKFGIWSQGPALAQQLRLLEGFADRIGYVDGIADADTVHLSVEAAKLAFADREAWYGDSADAGVLTDLVSREYAAERRELIGDRASMDLRPGAPGGRQPALSAHIAENRGVDGAKDPSGVGIGEPTVSPTGEARGDTVHIDVVDRWGNMVSATPSGGWLQSSPTIPELGFCLGSRAQMFWLDEGLPNSLAPGKRPRITLSPSLALRGGVPTLAFGTPGGDQQDQWQLCFWLAHVHGGLNLQEAIDSPAWHTGAFPGSFYPRAWEPGRVVAESRLGAETLAELQRRGHDVLDAGPWALGRLSAVSRDPETGILRAAANARGAQGYAAGR
ncbi:gamma-glutamyltransferase 2. Threonine peptidase. MEROPS family T03 [Saccharopolyspora kobensis]|uniref:Gamma-glutamyltransferase 2. Threonine peptidase. MEROPS family T03 n=1 Tax=Saccharopolyspora kobensis TaxID=146035 RepID=A0A1H6DGS9_9PSEU|nr:gamma-glutamyltransferase [Saccharopolyspora kobensis]SEG84449.1 gamma-glutamyltransferase 2. Threonine peptidase. MEROPS family T03 [Saccharopolyspora kobensis]SFD28105.1 gamma-glutamyltranspeptidase / glutathione hydrolase [Saccharopolyspora kobensis]